VELVNSFPTAKTFHRYLCPQGDIPVDSIALHSLTAEFLADKPLFDHVADELLAYSVS
jgi:DNA polymerase III subunit epsilon